jgi:hypothetical protein
MGSMSSVLVEAGIFRFSTMSILALGPTVDKVVRGKADHSPSSGAEVKNKWSYASTHPVCLHGM